MRLKTSYIDAKERIANLITQGDSLSERITREYLALRQVGAFDQKVHMPQWQLLYSTWLHMGIKTLEEIFPTAIESIKFKNSQGDATARSGTNIHWNSLVNELKAKFLSLYEISGSLENYASAASNGIDVGIPKSFTPAYKLAEAMVERYSIEDLKILCAALGKDIENITLGSTKRIQAHEIVKHFEKNDDIEKLIQHLGIDRPVHNWHDEYSQ